MKVRVWGTRGSYPVAKREMLRYGGNTTCVEVRVGQHCIVLDAGTGMRQLGEVLAAEATTERNVHLLITHTHWDHILGFPFFRPLYMPNTNLDIYGLQRTQRSLRTTIANALSDPLLPFGLEDLQAEMQFHEITHDMEFRIGDEVRIFTAQSNHPYRALGYRVETADHVLTFIPDTGPFHTVLFGDERVVWKGEPTAHTEEDLAALAHMRSAIVELARDADWLIYDSQFTYDEYHRFPHWGHSAPEHALDIADEAGVGELLLFHHDPHRTDEAVDAMVAHTRRVAPAHIAVRAAYEGMVLGDCKEAEAS